MIEVIKGKLDEARFFLGHLQEQGLAQAQVRKPPPEHFFYYLSAFLAAAKSVTSIVEREDKGWLRSWEEQLTDADDALKKLATDMRNDTVHEGRLETTSKEEVVPIPMTFDPYQIHALRAYSLSLRQGGGPRTARKVHYIPLRGKEQEIVSICERYVELLARVVKDFEDGHCS
jgi:hypothetical protein